MAVTIQELQVEVTEAPPPSTSPAAAGSRPLKTDLRSALHEVDERQKRLKAD
jgi:hypothetical protein